MGLPPGHTFANIFREKLENRFSGTVPQAFKPSPHRKYIDDIAFLKMLNTYTVFLIISIGNTRILNSPANRIRKQKILTVKISCQTRAYSLGQHRQFK